MTDEDPGGLAPWSNDLLKLTQGLNDQMRRSLDMAVPPNAIASLAAVIANYNRAFTPALEETLRRLQASTQAAASATFEWLRTYTPDNWRDLDAGVPLDVVDFVQETGIPVVWVPRAEIVDALIAANQDDRYEVLVSSSDDVLDDLDAALERARGANVPGHADTCEFAGEAIAAARDGHWTAAQALTASGLTQFVHRAHNFDRLNHAFRKFSARDVEEATMEIIKISLLEVCSAPALAPYDAGAPPERFNRHATQHGERRSFGKVNALAAMLLLVGWLREFTWLAEHDRLVDPDP